MKKITTFLLLAVFGFNAQAQFEFKKNDGSLIQNGDIINFTPTANYLNFRLTNTSNQALDIKFKCLNLVNSPGTQLQLCYGGSCFENVTINSVYPDYENLLAAGQSNPSQGEYLVNFYNPTNGQLVDLVFSVYALGFENNAITFTYRYDPNLSSNSFQMLENIGIDLKNTSIISNIDFNAISNGVLSIYNITGQLVATKNFNEGSNSLDLNHLNTSFYLARFTTHDGKSFTTKIYKN